MIKSTVGIFLIYCAFTKAINMAIRYFNYNWLYIYSFYLHHILDRAVYLRKLQQQNCELNTCVFFVIKFINNLIYFIQTIIQNKVVPKGNQQNGKKGSASTITVRKSAIWSPVIRAAEINRNENTSAINSSVLPIITEMAEVHITQPASVMETRGVSPNNKLLQIIYIRTLFINYVNIRNLIIKIN